MLATSQYQEMVIRYNQCFSMWISQSDCSIHIKLNYTRLTRVKCGRRRGNPASTWIQVDFMQSVGVYQIKLYTYPLY